MKKLNSHFLGLLFMILLTQTFFAQEKSSNKSEQNKFEPILFDTYSEGREYSESLLTKFADRFAEELKKAPATTKGVIIIYAYAYEDEECSKEKSISEQRYDFVRKLLIEKHKISSERISSIFGMWREASELELWLVPEGAKNPQISNSITQHCECPELKVKGIEKVKKSEKFDYFTAQISYGNGEKIEYKWSISAGKIVEGQGTDSIKVDISDVEESEITVAVEVDASCYIICENIASFTTQIVEK